jgi:hypothetical protein
MEIPAIGLGTWELRGVMGLALSGVMGSLKRLLSAFPPPPKRRYDLIGEGITRLFGGGGGGKGAIRAGGVERPPEPDSKELRGDGCGSRSGESAGELREDR